MRAWPRPEVDALPGGLVAPPVRVFDSASRGLVEVTPPSRPARIYVCGITPYDATHLGHAATYVAFDLLNRAWRSAGHAVHYVQNVTDVDDPLLERAHRTGEDWEQLAARETELFREDMAALRVLPPDDYVGAVESIPLVVDMVQQLSDAGAVYAVPVPDSDTSDLYFSVTHDPSFGEVSGWSREQMLRIFPERGGDPDRPGKKDPLDCLVWQAARPGEPTWESPWGPGRPGWHVECAAIARHFLDVAQHGSFEVQGGGSDLVFPHHEMSASEAQVVDPDSRFARTYVHAGMVGLDGEKMSKSKGNLVLVSQLRAEGIDPMAIRLLLLGHHYRSDWEWEQADMDAAVQRLDRWRRAVSRQSAPATGEVAGRVLDALAEDLDAPTALRVLDDWAESSGTDEPGAGAAIRGLVDAALGVRL